MKDTLPTPYPELNNILHGLVDSAKEILNKNLVGIYLQESFAVGDFDIHSDVDFIIVTAEVITNEQLQKLQIMHKRIYNNRSSWAQHLEGSYFPKKILRHCSNRGKMLWYLDNGSCHLVQSDHCNTAVVRWTVREKGVTLIGPSPKTLVEKIEAEILREDIFKTLNEWGKEIISDPDKYNNRFYQTFIVLSYCRMLHDLKNGTVGSKRAGAEWAKKNLNPYWVELIDRAWEGRPNPEESVKQPANAKDLAETLMFIKYIMDESKRV